jgi:hypothetical protein
MTPFSAHDRRIGLVFPAAALVGVALAVVSPDLTAFVVAGIALGVIAWAARLWTRSRAARPRGRVSATTARPKDLSAQYRSRNPLIMLALAIVIVLVVVANLSFESGPGHLGASRPGHRGRPGSASKVEIGANLIMNVSYDARTERLNTIETLTLEQAEVRQAATDIPRFRASPRRLRKVRGARVRLEYPGERFKDTLAVSLERLGWKETISSFLRWVFTYSSSQIAKYNAFLPAEQVNVVPVVLPATFVRFLLDEQSQAVVSVPQYAIGGTFPSPTATDTVLTTKRQLLHLPVSNDTSRVELDIRSAPFRNEALAGVVNITGWSLVKWLILAILPLASKSFRDLLKKGATGLKRRLSKRPDPPVGPSASH